MDAIEITRELGKALQQDEKYIRYMACKQRNDEDEDLQKNIGEFNLIRMQLNEEFSKDERDDDKIKEMNIKLRAAYDEIMGNEKMKEFEAAKSELDALVNRINGIIGLCLDGEDPDTAEPPEGCTGSCESCAGCH